MTTATTLGSGPSTPLARRKHNRSWRGLYTALTATVALALAASAWLGFKVSVVKSELESASQLMSVLKSDIARNDTQAAGRSVEDVLMHTNAARTAAADPIWTAAGAVPWLGANFQAIREIAISADDVSRLGAAPLVNVLDAVTWNTLVPGDQVVEVDSLKAAEQPLASAAHAVKLSVERLKNIRADGLMTEVSEPLGRIREQLESVDTGLSAAADIAGLGPSMLGADGQRNYLLVVQNNAEARASGGIPGALAVLTLNNGKLTLSAQSSGSSVGVISPVIPVDAEQQQIYSTRLGKYMQDVNLTPDFPTAATTAQAMWERKTGQRVDGVISMDPISLGYVLDATGPVEITDPQLLALTRGGLPTELNGTNVVPTLLSDVYAKIALPQNQDAYFAGVAKEIFGALSTGRRGDAKDLIQGISRGASEGRVLLWSGTAEEQSVITKYPVGGSISGPSVAPAQFGVYFNDGTGAKMDYYVKRTVQLVKKCDKDGYEQATVRITSTSTAPADAANSLSPYVTGAGAFGVPAGSVRTNVIAYGPVQSNVETAHVDGKKTDFAAHRHANRPVGAVTVTLAPGQSSTVELTFGKIVQHVEPSVVVTPTVQPVKDVILATENAVCNQ